MNSTNFHEIQIGNNEKEFVLLCVIRGYKDLLIRVISVKSNQGVYVLDRCGV